MKIDRLIGILSILLQQEKVTAPYLAERFEVSRRTINRDIEDICMAGIPLVTMPGRNGGISIMEGYRIDRTVLTSFEMQSILAGLRSLDSVSGSGKYQQLMDKLSYGSSNVLASNDHIVINLSSWYRSSLAPKIEFLQSAIQAKELIRFEYYGPGGDGSRVIEPYVLVFQWSSWYIWGYCGEREDYRLFKLNRMLNLDSAGEQFEARSDNMFNIDVNGIYTYKYPVKAVFPAKHKWRLIEEFGVESFEEQEDGTLLFSGMFANWDSMQGWLLTFGSQVEVLEPETLRIKLRDEAKKIYDQYL